ncbi:hypothetical protein JHK82_039262 [Glycine max]|uniref:CCHC-type domain-containing protein n=1 Tax=Glycine max TaxID=3847 RepID=K7M5U0_SOYBN|nr:hypothetical protein JHK87_039236 [Glycine soja]KAG4962572.1 hypothetical protein JHK86_039440 [Glycine max]KAG4965042.1 hypothetical protein JHK85_040017 [Glycine max]KAG5110039.1 hypothetical protein JHK82_039262 [Glycine max]KAG5121326.1 hypothetical protein JHK84_039666 [Glycine max]
MFVVWTKFRDFNELYNDIFLKCISVSFGKFLKIDKLTSIQSRGKFASIYVELDLEKPRETHIYVKGHKLFLEYEDLHSICFKCGRVGHKKDDCTELQMMMTEDQMGKAMELTDNNEVTSRAI